MSYPVEKYAAAQSSLNKANYEMIGAMKDVMNGVSIDESSDASVSEDWTTVTEYIDTAQSAFDSARVTNTDITSLQDYALVVANLATYLASALAYVESEDFLYADQAKYTPPFDSTWSM